ncbi:MAG: hypothetical protein AAB666_02540 [Patescibacteria group bacterium]
MVLETFHPHGAEAEGRRHGQEKKFIEPLAEQETFAPDLKLDGVEVETAAPVDEKEMMRDISHLEDLLHAVLLRECLESGDKKKEIRLLDRLKIEKRMIESGDVKVTDVFRNRKDCRSPGKTSSDEERMATQNPRNQVMMVEISTEENGLKQEAIFKPKNGEAVWVEEDGTTRGLIESRPQTGYLREWLAGFVAKALDSEVVPPTVIREIDGAIGSVQQKIDGRPANSFANEEWLEAANISDLREVALLDFLLENYDRHDGNYFIEPGGATRAIDHGLILPDPEFNLSIRSFPLRHFSAGDRVIPDALLRRLKQLFENARYEAVKEAFSLVFGQTQGEDFFAGFENRARGLIKDGEMPDYHMHPSDERYFWGHTATFLAPPTKIERKHAS